MGGAVSPPTEGPSGWDKVKEPDMIVALSAVLIGLCALAVSLVQVQIMRDQQHASVWPRLIVTRSYVQGKSVGIVAANPGIGPAVIRSVETKVDGRPVTSWTGVLNALAGEKRGWSMEMSSINGRIIPAGQVVTALQLTDPALADRVAGELHRLDVRVCFCSVYDRCWTITGAFADLPPEPQEVRACPAPGKERFRG